MTQHLHSTFVEGCYRCDLNRDEVTTDVNVTEKARQVQRRERGEAWDVLVPEEGWTVGRIVEDAIETTLDTLADPDVLAEIAGVLRDAEDEWVRRYADAEGAPPTRSEFQAAAVVERLTGKRQ